MSITIVNSLPEKDWSGFVAQHPLGNIFHTPEMCQVFAQTPRHQPRLWAAVDGDCHIRALLPLVNVTVVNGLLRMFTTRAVAYGGVLVAPDGAEEEALTVLLQTYRRAVKHRVLFTELRNLSNVSHLQPALARCEFAYEGHLNFLIDLQRPVDRIWSSLHSNARDNVKKARRKGVLVEEVTSLAEVPAAYSVLSQVYSEVQVPLAPLSLFEATFQVLHPKQMMKLCIAKVDNVCIAVGLYLPYKDVVYAWYGGALRDYAAYKANDLLNWHILEWAAAQGFRTFDFGGAGRPDEDYGPRTFKAKFGGELVEFGRNVHAASKRLLQLSQLGYRLYRQFL